MKCSACGNPHGSCLCDTPERRADRRATHLATLSRAVVDAAVEKHRMDALEMQWVLRKIEHGVYQVVEHVAANAAFGTAVDAYLAALEER